MFKLSVKDLAIDLGTANTLIYEKGAGLVLNEPSIVAVKIDGSHKIPVAFGNEAKSMLGRTPDNVQVIRPVRTGVIADFEVAAMMLSHFLEKVINSRFAMIKPRVVVGVPSGITEVEKRAIRDSIDGKVRSVKLIDEALASAIGCNLPITTATANIIVDIGGGTTDIAVISLSDIICSISIRQGGDAMDEVIINYLKKAHHLLIGETTAENIKKNIGSAHSDYDNQSMEVRGRSLISGAPAQVTVMGQEIREALFEVLNTIVTGICQALEKTPPELAGDIISNGIYLTGGGSLLNGFDKLLEETIGLQINPANDALTSVVDGAGKCVDSQELFKAVCNS